MLRQRGVAPISDSAAAWLREKHGASSSAGLLTLMASYRADKPTRKALRDKETSTRKRDRKEQEDMEHGYHERLCSLSSDFTHWNRYPSSWQSWQQVGSCVTREMHHDNLAEDIDGHLKEKSQSPKTESPKLHTGSRPLAAPLQGRTG